MANYCMVTLHIEGKIPKKKIKEFKKEVYDYCDYDITDGVDGCYTTLNFGVKWSADCWLSHFDIKEFFGERNWELISTETSTGFSEHVYDIDDCYDYSETDYTEIYAEDLVDKTYDEIIEEYGIDPNDIQDECYCVGGYDFEYIY